MGPCGHTLLCVFCGASKRNKYDFDLMLALDNGLMKHSSANLTRLSRPAVQGLFACMNKFLQICLVPLHPRLNLSERMLYMDLFLVCIIFRLSDCRNHCNYFCSTEYV